MSWLTEFDVTESDRVQKVKFALYRREGCEYLSRLRNVCLKNVVNVVTFEFYLQSLVAEAFSTAVRAFDEGVF